MSETCEALRAVKQMRQEQKAIDKADRLPGIDLNNCVFGCVQVQQLSEYHFRMMHTTKKWVVDIWPTTQRIKSVGKIIGPYIKVNRPFTLVDVIQAANALDGI